MCADIRNLVPYEETEKEIEVVNSRFIASLAPADNVDEAREFIKKIKSKYSDATHHVPIFLIGHGQSVTAHCNDDGEPSGTAGRPALAVLQGSGIGNVVIVVTRYFGGTKLGTGGLVRAYGDAVREVLRSLKLAEIVMTSQLRLDVDYAHYEPVKHLLIRRDAEIENEEFTDRVKITLRVLDGEESSLDKEIKDLTAGRSVLEIIKTSCETRKPI